VTCECCEIHFVRNSLLASSSVTHVYIGRYVPSSELVPGDVYEVTDPALTQFPCDSILLAGDCIVNESMLTGKLFLTPKLSIETYLYR
jgi:P-type E1-E2 ATPase